MYKRVDVVLLPEEELSIELAIRESFPEVLFIDQRQWTDEAVPPSRHSILDCGHLAAIWNPALAPNLRGLARRNGTIDGPDVGPAIQWIRSVQKPGIVEAGSLAMNNDPETEPDLVAFAKKCLSILRSKTTNDIIAGGWIDEEPVPGPRVRTIRVGKVAFAAAVRGELELVHGRLRLIPQPQ